MNILQNKDVLVKHLGVMDYRMAWDIQEEVFAETVKIKISNREKNDANQTPTPNYIYYCEHPAVFTIGKSGKREHLLISESQLHSEGINYYEINRGGDITFHGLGQLVVYPIIDMENFFTDIHKYMRLLEQAVMDTLLHYNILSSRIEGLTGVWVATKYGPSKICALGVKTGRWVTMHGLALNINTDLSFFSKIIPCGISDKSVTSMQELEGVAFNLNDVALVLIENIAKQFEMKLSYSEPTTIFI